MNDEPAISATNVSKHFKLPHEKHSGLKQAVLNFRPGKKTYEVQHVLNNVSFEIKRGEFFGIVGRNGSGKSTLLKILAGIYQPSEGQVAVYGKLVPFIELGVGFNPELTGRENVYLNGALLGFSRQETDGMYDGIVEFAEIEDFMDQKLKNYSSGMQVRLAFSIAIRAKSDILLIDEVLAVGDEAFQRKCLDIFEKYRAEKQTVVLVTHDMEMVRKFCTRAMLVSDGEIIKIGDSRGVADKYSELNQIKVDADVSKGNKKLDEGKYLRASILGANSLPKTGFAFGEPLILSISWKGLEVAQFESIGIHIFKLSGEHITGINTRTGSHPKSWKEQGEIAIEFKLGIMPGKYSIMIEAFDGKGRVIDSLSGVQFTVANTKMEWSGLVELPHTWRHNIGDSSK